MRVLSVRYPWSQALIEGLKDVENRDWKTGYRGLAAIHESRGCTRGEIEDFREVATRALSAVDVTAWLNAHPRLSGKIVGVVDMVDCVVQSPSPWFFGPYGFVMAGPRRLPRPIELTGALGLRALPAAVEARIAAQLAEIEWMAIQQKDPPRIDGLIAPAVLGKIYSVPTIEYVWQGRWDVWPVWLPKHHDREVGFHHEHYHIDGRFLTGAQWRFFGGKKLAKPGRPKEYHLAAMPLLYGAEGYPDGFVPFPEPRYRRRRLWREIVYPADHLLDKFPDGPKPLMQIAAAHKGKSLADPAGRQICPHKGAALANVRRDADGGVTCPLHGLSFGPDHVCVGLRRTPRSEGAA